MIKMISPRKLYPTESLFSIEENKILFYMECFKENIVTEEWKEKAKNLQDLLLRYSIPQKDEEGEISIIDIGLFQKEAAELIVLLLSAFDNVLKVDEDYTRKMKRQ